MGYIDQSPSAVKWSHTARPTSPQNANGERRRLRGRGCRTGQENSRIFADQSVQYTPLVRQIVACACSLRHRHGNGLVKIIGRPRPRLRGVRHV